jgi:hypothetical protein
LAVCAGSGSRQGQIELPDLWTLQSGGLIEAHDTAIYKAVEREEPLP